MGAKNVAVCAIFVEVLTCCFMLVKSSGSFGKVSHQFGEKPKYDCNGTITSQYGYMNSPNYPGNYHRYSRCTYIVERLSKDVCELKLTIQQFEVTKMPFGECSEDYLELQDGDKRFRICGSIPEGTSKFVFFSPHSNKLIFKFHSTFHTNKGFSIRVKQLPHSCYKHRYPDAIAPELTLPRERPMAEPASTPAPAPSSTSMPINYPDAIICNKVLPTRVERITSPRHPSQYKAGDKCVYTVQRSEPRACLLQLDFISFDVVHSQGCTMDYLLLPDENRLCGIIGGNRKFLQFPREKDEMKLEFSAASNGGKGFDIQVTQLPGPCDYEPATNLTVPNRQCDQVIRNSSGTLTSPGYPASFGPNNKCTYSIYRPDPTVCQLELDVSFFDLGKHNPASCTTGSYLELPGKNRICHELTGKVLLKVTEFQDPVLLYFKSDSHSSGRGFKIDVTQIPRTCSGSEGNDTLSNNRTIT